jgi:hypothetical protein
MPGKETKFCRLNGSNPYRKFADTPTRASAHYAHVIASPPPFQPGDPVRLKSDPRDRGRVWRVSGDKVAVKWKFDSLVSWVDASALEHVPGFKRKHPR